VLECNLLLASLCSRSSCTLYGTGTQFAEWSLPLSSLFAHVGLIFSFPFFHKFIFVEVTLLPWHWKRISPFIVGEKIRIIHDTGKIMLSWADVVSAFGLPLLSLSNTKLQKASLPFIFLGLIPDPAVKFIFYNEVYFDIYVLLQYIWNFSDSNISKFSNCCPSFPFALYPSSFDQAFWFL
jgi:hypothetical protein